MLCEKGKVKIEAKVLGSFLNIFSVSKSLHPQEYVRIDSKYEGPFI
jgi:hypothetical protein